MTPKAGVPIAIINKMHPAPTDADRAEVDSRIAALEAERKALSAFLCDAPRYDRALLAGPRIEHLITAEAA